LNYNFNINYAYIFFFSVLFNLYANENENVILREEFQRLIQMSECIFVPEQVQFLFSGVSYLIIFIGLNINFIGNNKLLARACQL